MGKKNKEESESLITKVKNEMAKTPDCYPCMKMVEESKYKDAQGWYVAYWIAWALNSIIFCGTIAIQLTAEVNRFPDSQAGLREEFPSVMSSVPFMTFLVYAVGYIALFFDMMICIVILATQHNRGKVIHLLSKSSFAGGNVVFFFYLSFLLVGNTLNFFDKSPWFYFGFNFGSFLMISMLADSSEIWLVLSIIWNREFAIPFAEYRKRNQFVSHLSWVEFLSFVLGPVMLKGFHFFEIFRSLLISLVNMTGLSDDALYCIFVSVFIVIGTLFGDLIAARKWGYGFIITWLFLGLAIGQATTLNTDGSFVYPNAWKVSTAWTILFFVMSSLFMILSVWRHTIPHLCKVCKESAPTHDSGNIIRNLCFGHGHSAIFDPEQK